MQIRRIDRSVRGCFWCCSLQVILAGGLERVVRCVSIAMIHWPSLSLRKIEKVTYLAEGTEWMTTHLSAAAGSFGGRTNREQMELRIRRPIVFVLRWTDMVPVANDASDVTPHGDGRRLMSKASSCTSFGRTFDHCTTCRSIRSSIFRTRGYCRRLRPVTKMTRSRLACVRRDRTPGCSRWARCCIGRRRWPVMRARPGCSSRAASHGESAG